MSDSKTKIIVDSANVRTIEILEPVIGQNILPVLENTAVIKQLDIKFGKKVVFNSIGIRSWITWLSPFSIRDDVLICLHECPVSVIRQANTVVSFIPANAEIVSFYAPFYSTEADETKEVLLIKGHHFFDDIVCLPNVLDKYNNPMTLDIPSSRYFSFLKNRPKMAGR